MAKVWQATCHLCRATLSPADRCPHLWMNERGQVYRVGAHPFEPEPAVVGKIIEVIGPKEPYRRPDIVLTPAAETEGE